MRQFSNNVQNALDKEYVEFFILLDLDFPNNYYRYTTLPYDVTFNGNSYTSDNGLFEYEPPSNSTVIDKESYRIAISDINQAIKDEMDENLIGAPISVRAGVVDANGDPLLGTDDVFLIYKGTVDAPSIKNDWDKRLAVIEGTSPMSDLDLVKTLITSKDGMDQYSSTDTAFDEVFEDQEINLKWGKN